jgi:hypothetical protein
VGTGHTFTLTGSTQLSAISVFAFSGIASNPLDVQNGANSTSGGTTFQPGSITPGTSKEVIAACFGQFAPGATATVNSSFTGLQQAAAVNSVNYGIAEAYLIQSTAGAVNPTFTLTASSSSLSGSQVSYMANNSPIPNCSSCAFVQSTDSGNTNVPSDPTSYTSNVTAGNLLVAFGWHTNWSGSGTTTVTGTGGASGPWHPCTGLTGTVFTDLQINSTGGMSCHWSIAIASSAGGATITATDCASNCTNLGGIYLEFSGVFAPRAFDAFASNTNATSTSGTNNFTTGSMTTTQANDLIIGYVLPSASSTAGTSPITFTAHSAGGNGISESAIWSSSGAINPTVSGTASTQYGGMSVAFR